MISLVPHPDEPTLEQALDRILPTQKEFIECPDRYTAYVGGFRAGKTVAGCMKLILFGQQNPGLYLIGRWNKPALVSTTQRTFLAMLPAAWVKSYDKQNQTITLKTGAQFMFRHLDVPDLHQHLRSLNLRGFLADEGSEISEAVFQMLMGRLSSGETRIGCVTSNPEGRNWIWRRFFDKSRPPKWQQMFRGFHATSSENINIPADYVEDLQNAMPADWFDRYVNASFSELSGSVYPEWDPTVHIYDPTQTYEFFGGDSNPPSSWPTYIGVDIGGVDPWAFAFWRFAPNGMAFKFAEIHKAGIFVSELAQDYFNILGNSNFCGLSYDYENQQAALELSRYNVNGERAVKDIRPGIFTVGHYMHINPNLVNPFTKVQGSPMFFVSSACENTIKEYADYKWAKNRSGEYTGLPMDGNDHQASADRYLFHTFHPAGKIIKAPELWENADLDEMSRLYYYEAYKNSQKKSRTRKRGFGRRSNRDIMESRTESWRKSG